MIGERGPGPGLDGSDVALANAVALTLLEPQPAVVGTNVHWANPASGNRGDLTMGESNIPLVLSTRLVEPPNCVAWLRA